jgi:ArsR family transcriptional regulator
MKRLERIFKALSDETRLKILGLVIRNGHMCVCEVERILQITQSKASRHLRYLRDAGLLEDSREGAIVNYGLPASASAESAEVLAFLEPLLRQHALPEAAPILVQIRMERDGEARLTDA